DAGRRELADVPREEGLDLLACAADRCRRGDHLRARAVSCTQRIDSGFIQPGERTQRSGDQMQLVLNDQLRRWLIRPEVEDRLDRVTPWQARELVRRCD